jgi:TPR repeat protein
MELGRRRVVEFCFGLGLLTFFLSGPVLGQAAPAMNAGNSDLAVRAEAGDPVAQYQLGKTYADGNGMPQDYSVAAGWYSKSAAKGNADAQNGLGILYMNGFGVPKDKAQAVRWYRQAAFQKNASAMFNLGAAYYNGDGVDVDDTLAYSWFLLALEHGSTKAMDAVARAEHELGPTTQRYGLDRVAQMYANGDGIPQDYSSAARWWRKAVDKNYTHGFEELQLSNMLLSGQGVPRDEPQAFQLCLSAAKKLYREGELCAAQMLQKGVGTGKNPREALNWYEKAAMSGSSVAMFAAGSMYGSGEAGKVDKEKALVYFVLSMRGGNKAGIAAAAKTRRELSPKEWKKTTADLKRAGIDPGQVELALNTATAE